MQGGSSRECHFQGIRNIRTLADIPDREDNGRASSARLEGCWRPVRPSARRGRTRPADARRRSCARAA